MENYRQIQIIDAMRNRLLSEMPTLEDYTGSIRRTDYRTASPGEMQVALAELLFDLDRRNAGQARAIQVKITEAEHQLATNAAPARLPRWLIQEPAVSHPQAQVPLTPAQAQSLRYLALPAMPAAGEAAPPSRFGQDLAACITLARALQLVKQRLPALKALQPYRFLMVIGYPAAVPTAHALRLAGYLGLVHLEGPGATAEYVTALQGIAHQSSDSIAALDSLFQLYANPTPTGLPKWDAICRPKNPRCSVCSLTQWCSHYEVTADVDSNAAGDSAPTAPRRKSVKDWSADERPRERMLAGERLSNSELLAIILRTGTGSLSAVELARELLHTFGTLHDLEKATPQEIVERMRGRGIGPAKAVEICAAIELGRRVTQPAADTRLGLPHVTTSRDIFDLCRTRYKAATQEEFLLLVLNTKGRVQKKVPVSLGTLNASIVHPRDVFRHALKEAAAAVIFVHNHPSGDPQPSDEDILLTARLVDAGKLLGIQVLDHVIIGSHDWYSFSDHGRLK